MSPLIEGMGYKAPAEVFIHMALGDIELLHQIAERRDRFRRYAGRPDRWGRGLIKHPILHGLIGEHALCVYLRRVGFNLSVDSRLLPNGDGGRDLEACGLSLQVKTNVTGNANLIRRIDDRRNLIPLGCDLFVFARVSPNPPGAYLKGWIWSRKASASDMNRICKSTVAEHWNLRIDPRLLDPMSRLLVELVSRRPR